VEFTCRRARPPVVGAAGPIGAGGATCGEFAGKRAVGRPPAGGRGWVTDLLHARSYFCAVKQKGE
jgi:hypothetical protein